VNTLTLKKQKGFTLITVLILSSLAGILVLNSLKDNINQERLSGNFQKKINSRLVSERGLFDSIAAAKDFLDNNPNATLTDLIDTLNNQIANFDLGTETNIKHGGTSYKVTMSEDSGELLLSSTGNRFEGESGIKARLKIVPGASGSPFADAVTGCDSVNLSGSGQIDSYDSSDSSTITYTKNSNGNQVVTTTRGTDGNVSTITQADPNARPPITSDIILGGNSPIYGDLSSAGGINTKTSSVVGNLHANGNIIIGSGSGVKVTGNVLTQGDYFQNGGEIGGHVRANGDALMVWSTFILNNKNEGLDILYGGTANFKDTTNNKFYEESKYNVFPNVEKVKDSDVTTPDYNSADPAANCDHLNIATEIDSVGNGASALPALRTLSTSTFTFTESLGSAEGHYTVNGDSTTFSSVNESVLGETLPVIKLASFFSRIM
jgi:hypothetical protein